MRWGSISRSAWETNSVPLGFGVVGRAALPEDGGLILQPCNGVVTFFMRFPIDVLFLDAGGRACRLIHGIKPWKASSIVKGAKLAVELPAGTLAKTGTKEGDTITFDPPL